MALCGLRAFPHQQLRKLLIALQDSSLPLTHAPVHHLLRQLLYHVGPVEDGELLWKRDVPGLMNEFKEVFMTLAEEFSAKPRAHEALPALMDLFNYFIQWESGSWFGCFIHFPILYIYILYYIVSVIIIISIFD